MSLSGGASDKLGNRYEIWWTVLQLVRLLNQKDKSIRIEDPTVEKAEFVISAGDREEFHQVKRSHPNGKWSLSVLGGPKHRLLQAIFKVLSGNNARFIFVSGSDAPELKELAERADSAQNLQEFQDTFLNAKVQCKAFQKLKAYWENTDTASAYEMLQRIEVRTMDEKGIKELVHKEIQALFLCNPVSVCDTLRSLALDSVHRELCRDDLVTALKESGFTLPNLSDEASVISEVTTQFLQVTKQKLIQDTLIRRAATTTILEKLKSSTNSYNCVLTGKAGGGKTGCVIGCVEALQKDRTPVVVLAFRLDQLNPAPSAAELGKRLGLKGSPALVLAAVAKDKSREAVLIIDQLDTVSTTSGRNADSFDAVKELLIEARDLRKRIRLHVIVVCREFDLENDHRLRGLLREEHVRVSVKDFTLEEVQSVIEKSGYSPELLEDQQKALLRVPQNLSLFLDANYSSKSQSKFSSTKELFDQYWKEKRRAVNKRANPSSDYWNDVIDLLCNEMTATQQLSVPKEKLNRFPDDYLSQMASEGVLSFDKNRYGFGHESFFDYCFARTFVGQGQSLVEFLIRSEQHLSLRAQVRQVLSYVRDNDRNEYCTELQSLLTHKKVRAHIKDLSLALAFSVPDPDDSEWAVLEQWIQSELKAFETGQKYPDKFASLVWQHFSLSHSWFQLAYRKKLIANWLASDHQGLVNAGVNYLCVHQRHAGDKVAELLEPYVGKGGPWPQHLCFIVQRADLKRSRCFFDLFLRLIDDGTLDEARRLTAMNSTFWSMLHGLGTAQPEWLPEVIAHWLRRRIELVQQVVPSGETPNWRDLFPQENFIWEDFHQSATKEAATFVLHVAPVLLEAADAAVTVQDNQLPRHDSIWPFLVQGDRHSLRSTCLDSLTRALEALAKTESETLTKILDELRRRDTYISNYLLQHLYISRAKHFADEVVELFSVQPWRFYCGYVDNIFWVTKELLRAVIPHCSSENRQKLEEQILGFSPDYERREEGHKWYGLASFELLSAFPPEFRSKTAQKCFEQLERKFDKPTPPPTGVSSHIIRSPIEERSAQKMTDDQWLRAIAKYSSNDRQYRWENPEKGGAIEFARMLREFVQKEPERFARLSLRFPEGAHVDYIDQTLDGLKNVDVSTDLKLQVCRKAYSEYRNDCGKTIADLLGAVSDTLPDDAVQMLDWLATQHPDPDPDPDPDKELWSVEATGSANYGDGDRIILHGINTTRGRAAKAIHSLISCEASYIERFRATVVQLVADRSVAVRACASTTLLAIAPHDWDFALKNFFQLIEPQNCRAQLLWRLRRRIQPIIKLFPFLGRGYDRLTAKSLERDDCLLMTRYAEKFIFQESKKYFPSLRPVVERMLRSRLAGASNAGGQLASLAALRGEKAANLVREALNGHSAQRLGVAQIASRHIGVEQYRIWSEKHLLILFNDTDVQVLQKTAECFRYLHEQSLAPFENLIVAFCDSAAYQESSSHILSTLEKSSYRIPGVTYIVCKKFLDRFSNEAKDISTRRSGDVFGVIELLFRTYHQHKTDEWASRCLDLIDRMCLEGIHDIKSHLDEYEK